MAVGVARCDAFPHAIAQTHIRCGSRHQPSALRPGSTLPMRHTCKRKLHGRVAAASSRSFSQPQYQRTNHLICMIGWLLHAPPTHRLMYVCICMCGNVCWCGRCTRSASQTPRRRDPEPDASDGRTRLRQSEAGFGIGNTARQSCASSCCSSRSRLHTSAPQNPFTDSTVCVTDVQLHKVPLVLVLFNHPHP